ncbi:MAG: DUF3179 domain-containing protein [Flavobacteriales bacterium]|nr:DUF3179 domain-containing protein [Flavobacteriales bacterium]
MRPLLFLLGILLLLVPEILRVYYIMPFPGSQEDVATDLRQVDIAYWLHTNIWWVRLVGLALIIGPCLHYIRHGNGWKRLAVVVPVALAATVFYLFNFKFMADAMFLPVEQKAMAPVKLNDSNARDLVIAVERNGDARAYPIELIGYHHQVLDTIDGEPVMVTYCTVCRTGRAFSPVVNGEPESFRLVGMDHYNAMFEDSRTKSWWRQATGECIAGPLKGQLLAEVPSQQMTLAEWSSAHPNTLVLQPDPSFLDQYAGLEDYDEGTIASSLEGRDTASWQPKSWVVGVVHNGVARAYDWNDLMEMPRYTMADPSASPEHQTLDTLGGDTICVIVDDAGGFRVNRCTVQHEDVLNIGDGASQNQYVRKEAIPAYQEFWHSWRTFHPNTTRYMTRQ